jgi:hypothetical protein
MKMLGQGMETNHRCCVLSFFLISFSNGTYKHNTPLLRTPLKLRYASGTKRVLSRTLLKKTDYVYSIICIEFTVQGRGSGSQSPCEVRHTLRIGQTLLQQGPTS